MLLLREAAIRLENPFPRHRLDQQLGERPDKRIDPVWRISGRGPVEIVDEPAHLVFERRKGPQMMHPALLVERGDRLGPGDLAARGMHRGERHVRIDHAQRRLYHLAAIVHLGDDSVGVARAVGGDRRFRPLGRRIAARHIRQHIALPAGKDTGGQGYVLADVSGRYAPTEWAKAAIAAYRAHDADRVVAEVNNGGEMVEATLRVVDPNVPCTAVHAALGKVARAETVAALYEQGRVHHLGAFPALKDKMCGFVHDFDRAAAGYSPDRVDALVWALTELLVEPMPGEGIFEAYRRLAQQEHEAP